MGCIVRYMMKYTARTAHHGHGRTHLFPTMPERYKIQGILVENTERPLCRSQLTASYVNIGEVDAMPDVAQPCPKCAARA